MSDDVEHNFGRESEQITKTPIQENVKKEKDPKKVAAGKKLAEHNRRAKEALKREMKREAEKAREEETGESQDWFPELSFTTVVSLVGIGLTAINMFMSYNRKESRPEPLPQVEQPKPQPSKIPVPQPKMGMI